MLKESDATAGQNQQKNNIGSILYPIAHSPINYVHHQDDVNDFKRQPLLVNPLSYIGPCMAKGDIDGDGKEDIFIGGGNGFPACLYRQTEHQQFEKLNEPAFDTDAASNDACAVMFDANGDGKLDLFVATGGYNSFEPNASAITKSFIYQ